MKSNNFSTRYRSLSGVIFEPVVLGPSGPRKRMKIAQSEGTIGKARERRDRILSGAVETVTLSDQECA